MPIAEEVSPETIDSYQRAMERYTTAHLVDITPESFKNRLDEFLALRDHEGEGLPTADGQRDLTVNFHWGHDHDFGSFRLDGRMKDRHIQIPAAFQDRFSALPDDLRGIRILDVGCWTGGTSLLLCALGAEVTAIEEVRKYAECLSFLKEAFAVDSLEVQNISLFDLGLDPSAQDKFDIILYSGVLYHVTDPVLSLRLCFNMLRDSGRCLVETMSLDSEDCVLAYQGPTWHHKGTQRPGSRGGWNWLIPSPAAIHTMMTDVGFVDVEGTDVENGRAMAVGQRINHVPILRSGLADRRVR